MKIPKHLKIRSTDLTNWKQTAYDLSLKYGVYIEVVYTNRTMDTSLIEAVQFKVLDHTFEGSNDLVKALEMKAFL